jgi:hypothetical protein
VKFNFCLLINSIASVERSVATALNQSTNDDPIILEPATFPVCNNILCVRGSPFAPLREISPRRRSAAPAARNIECKKKTLQLQRLSRN